MLTLKVPFTHYKFSTPQKLLFVFFIFFAQGLFAYPELARHGYTNCTSCHLSPSGGGLMTPYGRELSKEILSTWGAKDEQYFAYGKIKTDEKVLLGAFIRGLQVREDNPQEIEARTILMQADAEAAYNAEKWAIDISAGRQEIGRGGSDAEGRFFSRRYFLLYRPSEQINVRAGKFLRFFGLNDPNHNLYVRRDLNFGYDTETENLELSYLGDNWSSYLTFIDGSLNKDQYTYLKDRAVTFSTSYFFQEKNKIGISLYQGEEDLSKRSIAGAWLIYAWTPAVFLMSEFDWQNKTTKATDTSQSGYVTSHRLNYEFKKGIIPFLQYERSDLASNSDLARQSYGLGLQFFPRPHIELVGTWQKEENPTTDLLWLLVHFYL